MYDFVWLYSALSSGYERYINKVIIIIIIIIIIIRLYTTVPPKGFVLALDWQSLIWVNAIVLQNTHRKEMDFEEQAIPHITYMWRRVTNVCLFYIFCQHSTCTYSYDLKF